MTVLVSCAPARAQADKNRDPLTEEQAEQVREVADQPPERVKLYLKFVEERTDAIHKIDTNNDKHPFLRPQTEVEIHNLFEEFTRLCDEVQDNLDSYADQHEDLRKPLKDVVERSGKWPAILNEPVPSQQYDFARKTALDAAQSLHEMASKLLDEQTKYFIAHPPPKH